mmetsp:Transcript_11821/g.19405  ORF Transcript_11821/g.19405 Transcript_11821/m.19405 type:complete len:143 (-) Transcript_11821:58-486(-)
MATMRKLLVALAVLPLIDAYVAAQTPPKHLRTPEVHVAEFGSSVVASTLMKAETHMPLTQGDKGNRTLPSYIKESCCSACSACEAAHSHSCCARKHHCVKMPNDCWNAQPDKNTTWEVPHCTVLEQHEMIYDCSSGCPGGCS